MKWICSSISIKIKHNFKYDSWVESTTIIVIICYEVRTSLRDGVSRCPTCVVSDICMNMSEYSDKRRKSQTSFIKK
jgi:hypothetical protein